MGPGDSKLTSNEFDKSIHFNCIAVCIQLECRKGSHAAVVALCALRPVYAMKHMRIKVVLLAKSLNDNKTSMIDLSTT